MSELVFKILTFVNCTKEKISAMTLTTYFVHNVYCKVLKHHIDMVASS